MTTYSLEDLLLRLRAATPQTVRSLYFQNQPLFEHRPDIAVNFVRGLSWKQSCALVSAASTAHHVSYDVWRALAAHVALQSHHTKVDWCTATRVAACAATHHGHHLGSGMVSSAITVCANARHWRGALAALQYADRQALVSAWMLPAAARACAAPQWVTALRLLGLFGLRHRSTLAIAAQQPLKMLGAREQALALTIRQVAQAAPWQVSLSIPLLRESVATAVLAGEPSPLAAPWHVALHLYNAAADDVRTALLAPLLDALRREGTSVTAALAIAAPPSRELVGADVQNALLKLSLQSPSPWVAALGIVARTPPGTLLEAPLLGEVIALLAAARRDRAAARVMERMALHGEQIADTRTAATALMSLLRHAREVRQETGVPLPWKSALFIASPAAGQHSDRVVSMLLQLACACGSSRGALELLRRARGCGVQLKDEERVEAFLTALAYSQLQLASAILESTTSLELQAALRQLGNELGARATPPRTMSAQTV